MAGSQPGVLIAASAIRSPTPRAPSIQTTRVATLFGVSAVVTFLAGVALEISGNELANRAGINGVVFGATVLALASALPEISSGIERTLGDHQLAMATFLVQCVSAMSLRGGRLGCCETRIANNRSRDAWLASLSLVLTWSTSAV